MAVGNNAVPKEDDLIGAGKLAGIALTPEFRGRILDRLQELRTGVLRFRDKIGEDTIPADRFTAE